MTQRFDGLQPGQAERTPGSLPDTLPDQDHHLTGESCLGAELLSQLAGLSLSAALLERDHESPSSAPRSSQVCYACYFDLRS